jgi:Nucleotidyl transferase AbiEii toxin, Type IV TA system
MTKPIGLQPDDLAETMAAFGVAEAQVRRDHAISHILAALSRHRHEELIFFGGTALSRTYLLDERLSEDIDLIGGRPPRQPRRRTSQGHQHRPRPNTWPHHVVAGMVA